MRIIGGKASSRILSFPKSPNTRPVTERTREAVFDILNKKVLRSSILDLYAGSGSLGLEALSRGAKRAIFVDENRSCFQIIKKNLNTIDFLKSAKLCKEKVENFLRENKEKFDLIFIDPPWKETDLKILNILYKFLKPEGIIILFHSKKFKIKNTQNLSIVKQKQYGDSGVTFLK